MPRVVDRALLALLRAEGGESRECTNGASGLCSSGTCGVRRSERGRVRDAGQEDTHGRQPLLAVNNSKSLHHPRRAGFREREERAAVVGCLGAGDRDREEILDQPFDVGLTPAVATLPPRHDVLDLSIEELQELDVMGVHGFTFF